MIELKDAVVELGGKEIIKQTSTRISGKTVLLGPNGSGKTTLLRAMAGVIPYRGSIMINGIEVKRARNVNAISTNLPEAFVLGLTMEDVIYLYEEIKQLDGEKAREMLREVGITDLKKKVYELSAGQGVLFRTIIALSSEPEVILLDEPFENVDAAKRYKVANWIKEFGKEGVIVTHELDIAKTFKSYDSLIILEGRLHGLVNLGELLDSTIEEGEVPGAILYMNVGGRKFSLIKQGKGKKFEDLILLDRIYNI
ncbi:Mn2+/Zn2+ABC transporter ATP-binding protein [Sulfolobales archaeon HS-7]|nr:Mn2+/Zn2+ABC transporter ATP-binding protein [Sulfolobales archaeon HS-7]